MLFELVEIELHSVASQFGKHAVSITQFDHSLHEISENCSIVLKCFDLVERPTPFEDMIIRSTSGIKSSTEKVRKNLSGQRFL